MNKLITTNSNLLINQPSVLKVVKEELFNVVNKSIAKCYADLNMKIPDEQTLSYLINEVTDAIMEKFPSLRLQEIPIAFSNGVRNHYGEYFGLSVITFEQFLQGYLESPERLKLVEEKTKLMIETKTEPTDEQKAQLAWNNLVLAWKSFKQNGYYNDYGNSVYNTLDANRKINFTKEQKLAFKAEALKNLEKQYNPLQYMGNVVKINEARGILDEIRSSDQSTRLIAECKKLALNQFFKELVDLDMEIEDVFEASNFDLA